MNQKHSTDNLMRRLVASEGDPPAAPPSPTPSNQDESHSPTPATATALIFAGDALPEEAAIHDDFGWGGGRDMSTFSSRSLSPIQSTQTLLPTTMIDDLPEDLLSPMESSSIILPVWCSFLDRICTR
jgi:hypothetical protein